MKKVFIFLSFIAFITALDTASSSSRGLLVYPRLLEERGSDGSHVLKINEDITLNLKKSSVLGEEFLLKSYVGDVEKHTYMDGSYLEEDLFHDADAMASLTLSNNGELQVEGVIGPKLRIMPAREQERSSEGRAAHMIYEIPDGHFGLHNDTGKLEKTWLGLRLLEASLRELWRKLYKYSLFVVCDQNYIQLKNSIFNMFSLLYGTRDCLSLHFLINFTEFVGLCLRLLYPLFQAEKERFLQRVQGQPHYIYGPQSLATLREYVKSQAAAYKSYDLVYLITGRELELRTVLFSFIGYAYIGGACSELKVGLGEDTANTFRGVHIMTHEVGH
ncbi:metalloprotease, putative, partial [Ixodes scapularis]